MSLLEIKEAPISAVVSLSQKIPEFINPHPLSEYQKRLEKVPALVLVAYQDGEPAGFKVGYEREGYFYSWMGGILPSYRRLGIARKLAEQQEVWAKKQGYPHVTFKTRNNLKAMLLFAIGRGFDIIAIEKKEAVADYRIILRKTL